MKKRRFLLFELLLAVTLSALLLSVVFRVFSQTILLEKTVETVKARLFSRQFCYFRLHDLFSRITLSASLQKHASHDVHNEKAFLFFTTPNPSKETLSQSLYFAFDNGIDPDPKFSGPVFAKLSIDKQQRLILKIAPYKKMTPFIYRKEVLLKNVESQKFLFCFLESDSKTKKQTLKTSSCWEKTEKILPMMFQMRLQISSQKKPVFFAFFFPSETTPLEIP